MQITRTVLLLVLPLITGCGGASLVLKSPIEGQCTQAGLSGCPEIVHGTLAYVDGDKPGGKEEMLRGTAANAPEKVKKFAAAIKALPLEKIPGAKQYVAVINEIADILLSAPAGGPAVAVAQGDPGPAKKTVLLGLPLTGSQIDVLGEIEFDVDKSTIRQTPQTIGILTTMANAGRVYPQITRMRIEGHTDSDGNEPHNQQLSEARAREVMRWLVEHGIEARRLIAVGCGSRDPLVPNTSAENKQRNRRTEFDIEEVDGTGFEFHTAPCSANTYRKR